MMVKMPKENINYVERVDEAIRKLPPLSVWEEDGVYPQEAVETLNIMAELLRYRGIKAGNFVSALHPCLPCIEIEKSRHLKFNYNMGIGFDEELDYSDVDDHSKKEPELVFWDGDGEDEKHPFYSDWDVYSVSEWRQAFKNVLKVVVNV